MGCNCIRRKEQRLTRKEWQELERNQALEAKQERQQRLRIERLAKLMPLATQMKEDQDIPNPKRGLEGLKEADHILKEKGLIGIVIGGLGRDLYSDEPSEKALAKLETHKDVDVLVLPPRLYNPDGILPNNEKHFKKFEGGIDWWFCEEKVEKDYHSYIQRIHNGYGSQNFFILKSDGYSLVTNILRNATSEEPGLYVLPQRYYEDIFVQQKAAEMSKLHPDFAEITGEFPSGRSKEKMLIPAISELFPVTKELEGYSYYSKRYFTLDQEIFDKVWDKQQGTLERENEARSNLRKKLREAKTEGERLVIVKELSLDQPNRKREADKLHDLRAVRDQYLNIRANIRKKSRSSKQRDSK